MHVRLLLSVALFSLLGCSSSSDSASAPAAPRLVELAPMGSAIHVTWVNEEKACDSNEIERRTEPQKDFAVVYTLSGAIDNKHDDSATENATYDYRVRCKKAGIYSAYSNEMSANPTIL